MKIRYFEKRGTWWLDFKDAAGIRRRVPSGCATETDAKKAAPSILARTLASSTPSPDSGSTVAPGGALSARPSFPQVERSQVLTFEQAYKKGLRERAKWMQAKDSGGLQAKFDALAAYWGADSPLSKATRDAVLVWRAAMMKEPGKREGSVLTASTINHRLSMLSVLLEVADLAPHGVKHLSTKGNARHRRVTEADFARCIEWAGEQVILGRSGAEEFARLLPAGLCTGARLSELLDLLPQDVGATTVTFRDTKNGLTRSIPMRPAARKALLVGTGKRPFPTLTADRVTVLWDLMRTSMGLKADHRFVFHLLRHECASRFADEGKGAHFIKAWLGHENIATSESYVNMSVGGLAAQVGVDLTTITTEEEETV